MSTSTTSLNCPKTLPVPFTVTVNTSGTTPIGAAGHPSVTTHAGFTRISKFTLSPIITALGDIPAIEDLFPNGVSNSFAKWDFGDGYTLSGANSFTTTHIYNVPGIYTVTVFLYDKDSNAYSSTFTETISVYNYANTGIAVETRNITEQDGINARKVTAGENKTFNLETTASWQDVPDPADVQTLFFTSSGSQTKPYDFNNKYAHIVPYNAFYDKDNNIINNVYGLEETLYPHYFYVNSVSSVIVESSEQDSTKNEAVILYSSTDEYIDSISSKVPRPIKFSYYDDLPDTTINLLIRLDTSKHRIKSFYVDDIDTDINNSNRNFLETDVARPIIRDKSTINKNVGNSIGIPIEVITPYTSRLSFTSTGMKEMSAIQYKRQGDKFQVFVALTDENLNIGKYYNIFRLMEGAGYPAQDRQFAYEWSDGTNTITSNISSLSTAYFPYNGSETTLSSFAYLNINPVSAGTWSLNITGSLDSLATTSPATNTYGLTIDYDPNGPLGPVSLGVKGSNLITGSYTFTVFPSTNDVEIYKINEDVDYSKILKSYRFQSLQHEYDKLFDGIFTSFVGEASSSPTTFGKTIFEKIANFTINNSDVDFCNINNLESFYELFNEDIDISLPEPPAELKRLYNLFSIKISKLLGDYERYDRSFDTQFYTSSAASRNIDFENPITASTYTITAGTPFIAKQKFNSEYILIKPQQIPNLSAAGEVDADNPVLSTYYLSTYNSSVLSGYSTWGWPLDTTISGASGLDLFYEFYPYTTYNIVSAENVQNNIIDYNNIYNTITRASSSLSADWDPAGGIVFKNLDYQIRKGLQL
jgi:hypothetical protein